MDRELEFPWWCETGDGGKRYWSGEKVLWGKYSTVKYEFWTCWKCGDTVRVCMWRTKTRN